MSNDEFMRFCEANIGVDRVEIVVVLLKDKRVNPCTANSLAMRWAVENGRFEIVKLLLEDGRCKRDFESEKYPRIQVL